MNRKKATVFVSVLSLGVAFLLAQDKKGTVEWPKTDGKTTVVDKVIPKTEPNPKVIPTPHPVPQTPGVVEENETLLSSPRERMRLGVRIREAKAIARELRAAGKLDENTSESKWASLATAHAMSKNSELMGEGFDVDTLFEWFANIWPIIQMFLKIFAQQAATMLWSIVVLV